MTLTADQHTEIVSVTPVSTPTEIAQPVGQENTLKSLEEKFAAYFGTTIAPELLPKGIKIHLDTSIYEGKEVLNLNFIFPEPSLKLIEFNKAIKASLGKLSPVGSRLDIADETKESLHISDDKPAHEKRYFFDIHLKNMSLNKLTDELHTALTTPELQQYSAPTVDPIKKNETNHHQCSGADCKDCKSQDKTMQTEETAKILPQPDANATNDNGSPAPASAPIADKAAKTLPQPAVLQTPVEQPQPSADNLNIATANDNAPTAVIGAPAAQVEKIASAPQKAVG